MSIRDIRHQRGLSQEAAAEALGIKQSYYSRVERGKGNPTIGVFRRLADLYEAQVDELVRAFIEAGATLSGPSDEEETPRLRDRLTLTFPVAPRPASPLAACA